MTPAEAGKLLAFCAVFDNRKPDTSGMAAHGWAEALQDLDYTECRQAVVKHFAHSIRYILPADIRTLVEEKQQAERDARLRAQAVAKVHWKELEPANPVPMPDFVKRKLDEISQRRQCEHGCLEQPVEDAS
jgi:hypothetical protein